MKPHADFCIYISFTLFILLSGCRTGITEKPPDTDTIKTTDSAIIEIPPDTVQKEYTQRKKIIFYGDTVWINPYGSQIWNDTLTDNDYTAFVSVTVDTSDYIIDTVKSRKGKRIVIGYNHRYELKFSRDKKLWFTVSFDKKNRLENTLRGTDYWLESNLDVFQNLVYNEKYDMFIIEYDINSRFNYGAVYYIVFDTEGIIHYTGKASNWGGGGPDGESFLTQNGEMYISCFELYNFSNKTSFSISEYTLFSDVLNEFETEVSSYKQIHAIRNLSDNKFLLVFDQIKDNPTYNAVILNTDSIILDRFSYKGLREDVDAIFLFYPDTGNYRYFIHDTEREVLVSIEMQDSLVIRQLYESVMKELPNDSALSDNFLPVDFESFGSKIFYISDEDSVMFFREGVID